VIERARLRQSLLHYLLDPIAGLSPDQLRREVRELENDDIYDRIFDSFRDALSLFDPAELWASDPRSQIGAVEQTALAIARAAQRTDLAGRTGFVCDPEPVVLKDLARLVGSCSGRRTRLVELPDSAVRLAGALETIRETVTRRSRPFNADKAREVLAGDWLCDSAPLRRDLDLPPPTPLEDGLRATWAWYRQEGWLGA